ncbi:uncharacterized protein BP01DRAFT_396509 [Aspergillus saccharolyticus JOP 1030-1]|uniref:GDP-mannose transporter n=1 Tax=Aspergillus saccharolyticus JOP 1030-1 TaxID=1450539 RepID=A0A318ZQN0_9EURO|nr:hypothetical protein BP01DRAFT_396509 [Aspergillus saccharolyticus JOP 1030-1]PYH49816.1 hypothetical protein BP01DRAFT_396509 [Aspergillus saccharolyticus JOP 1030-1]
MPSGDEKESQVHEDHARLDPPEQTHTTSKRTLIWTAINISATVAIVYVNKSIFSDPSLSQCHFSFVAYHFTITGVLLFIARRVAQDEVAPTKLSLLSILPLSLLMCANIVLMNLSLAHSSILGYQIVRVLLTPLTALIHFFCYGATIPSTAVFALVPACAGAGLVTYSSLSKHPHAPTNSSSSSSSPLGIIYALSGVFCSALYILWVAHYYARFHVSSVQLLYKQMPFCASLIGVVSLFTDTFPAWDSVRSAQWGLLLLSGGCACLVNLSTFYVIGGTGPVSSTVVGQLKSCLVIGLGWVSSSGPVGWESVLGVGLASFGIVLYAVSMCRVAQ